MRKGIKGLVFIGVGLILITLIGCSSSKSGVSSNGRQINVEREKNDRSPLYVVNGTVLTSKKSRDDYLLLKPAYFKETKVLGVDESTDKYGDAGKYGTIEVQLTDSTTAYNDLVESASSTEVTKMNLLQPVKSEREPTLIGGLANLQRKLEYPEECRDAGAKGQVITQFIINKKGQVEDPSILRGIGWGCDGAVIRLVKQSAEFLPALVDGKPVNVRYSIPFNFRLQ